LNNPDLILQEIRTKAEHLAQKLSYPLQPLPRFHPSIEGTQIEIDRDGNIYYVFVERGIIEKREHVADVDELLFKLFSSITFAIACNYELDNRDNKQDCRRKIFAKQEDLLGLLNEQWKLWKQKEHAEILKRSPFDDNYDFRLKYFKSLKTKGLSSEEAWEESCQIYPLPNSAS